jgi:hypothetical protein
MPFISWVALVALVPVVVGGVAGRLVRDGERYRWTPALAGLCTLALLILVAIVGFATTPQSACGGTGCDNGYSVGIGVMVIPVFLLALAGVAAGRNVARRRHGGM